MVDRGIPLVEIAVDFANVSHARCILPLAQAVEMRRKCLFNRETIDPCIAAIVTSRNARVVQTTDDHVGNLYDRYFGKSRRLV